MSNGKKPTSASSESYAAIQSLIAKGRKDGVLRASELNAELEKLDISPEKIEELYDRFESMGIQIIGNDLGMDMDDDLDLLGDLDDVDLDGIEEEELIDPVELVAEYNLDDPVRM